jgi:hypothetical protein
MAAMERETPDVLQLLIDHESAIKHLYQAFAASFPDFRDFWLTLAGDEQGHADKLERLRTEPALDEWLRHESQFKPPAIRSSIDYLDGQLARAQGGGLSLLQALAIATDLESALIERQFLIPGGPACAEIRSVLTDLNAETERHREVVANALETEKRLHP